MIEIPIHKHEHHQNETQRQQNDGQYEYGQTETGRLRCLIFERVRYLVGIVGLVLRAGGGRRCDRDRRRVRRRVHGAVPVGHGDVGARPKLLLGPAAHRPGAVLAHAPVVAGDVLPLQHALAARQPLGQRVPHFVHLVFGARVEPRLVEQFVSVPGLHPSQHVLVQTRLAGHLLDRVVRT